VQRGEGKEAGRSSLPKGMKPDTVDLETALALLSLPREVARHPSSGEPILAGIGRFGPYVQHGRTYANLGKDDDVLTIGQNRAIDLIVAKENGGGGRRGGGAPAAGKVLGDHPSGGAVSLLDGRYGPYVKHGKVNATLPKDIKPDAVTLEQAIALIDAKGASGSKASSRGKQAAKPKKAAAKTAPAAKAAAGRKK
jgi:DNA topoisomerase-1